MAPLPALRESLKSFFGGFSDSGALERKGFDTMTFNVSEGELYRHEGFDRLARILDGSGPNYAGEHVTNHSTLGLSVAWAANRLITECTALLPFEVYQRKGPGELLKREDLPIYDVFHYGNDMRTSMDMRSTWTHHLLNDGNCFAQIERRSGTGVALDVHPLLPGQVLPEYEKESKSNFPRLQYTVHGRGNSDRVFFVTPGVPQDIFHVRGMSYDGLVGYGVVRTLHNVIANGLAAQKNAGRFFAHGARLPYVLETGKTFAAQAFDEFRADWEDIYRDPHKAAMLEKGMKYVPIGVSAKEAQSQEFLQWMLYEICRIYGISPTMVGDLTKANYNSIDVLAQQFVKFTLHPWLVRFEMAFRRCILTPKERQQKIFARHNVRAILRGEFVQRMTGYATMIQNGIASINEAREWEDMPPIENGDGHNQQMQMQPAANGGPRQSPAQISLRDDDDEKD